MPFYRTCPHCGSNLDPGERCTCDGAEPNADEMIAREMLESLGEMQKAEEPFPCPRCGHDRMDIKPVRNALSRRASVYICNECGMNEAIMDATGMPPLPLSKWSMIASMRCGANESAV